MLSWLWIVGLDIAIIVLAWKPLQKRERWAFWTLLVLFLFAQGSHFFSSLLVPAGKPGEAGYNYALGAGLIFGYKGLDRSRRHCCWPLDY